MKKQVIFAVILGVFSLFFSFSSFAENLDGIAAIVNDSVITKTEFNNALKKAQLQLTATKTPNPPSDSDLKKMVMQQLIDEKLQLEMATRAKLTISDKQLAQTIANIAKGNHMTVPQLKQAIAQEGMNYDEYEKTIHKQLLIHQVQEGAVGAKVHVTPEALAEAKKMLQTQNNTKEYHLVDITLDNQKAAETLLRQLKNGASLGDDVNDMGWQTASTLPDIFVNQLQNMTAGDVAGPIQAPNGFHVIKLLGVRGGTEAISKVQLQNVAYQILFQKEVAKWLVELRKSAYIKTIE